ncbi:hypothetical protein BH11PLA2_BH11PLA2_07540 [soil metagenome]
MNRILLGMIIALNVGCLNIRLAGPLADGRPSKAQDDAPVPEPVVRQAPKPTPPALYVTPGEVTPANAADAAKRLQQELDTDRRGLDAMPKYTDVSVIKGGVK